MILNENCCQRHNKYSVCYDNHTKQFLCSICVNEKFNLKFPNEQQEGQYKTQTNQIEMSCQQNHKIMSKLIESLELHKNNYVKICERLIQSLYLKINETYEKYNSVRESEKGIEINIQNFFEMIKSQISKELADLENASKIDTLHQIFQNFNSTINTEQIEQKHNYQLEQKSSYKLRNEYCYSMAINKDSTLLIIGCQILIYVYSIQDLRLKEIQQLQGHDDRINCLLFMKKSDQFISSSNDKTIIIWEGVQPDKWEKIQILKHHTSKIYTLAINYNENMIFSGAEDKIIKFWCKQYVAWKYNQSVDCNSPVLSISKCDFDEKLIASLRDNQILILQLDNQIWSIKQKIQVEQYSCRLSFINKCQFLLQPFDRDHLLIYEYDMNEFQFKQIKAIKYKNKEQDASLLFPISLNKAKDIAIVKNNHYLNLIHRDNNGNFSIKQIINFGTSGLFGCFSDDGNLIITWDDKSQDIQIRVNTPL